MEWLGFVLIRNGQMGLGRATEQLQRLGLRGSSEGEVADVLAAATGSQGQVHHILGRELFFIIQLLGHQHLTQLTSSLAGLAGVSLIGHHRKAAGFQAGALLNRLEHMGEGLNGDDNDGSAAGQCLGQLSRFAAIPLFPINAGDHPGCVIELSDGLLQLAIEHGTVGDDDDGIE